MTLYDVVYADPAWDYNNKASEGSATNHYDTMRLKEIMSLRMPIKFNAALFLWATSPMLPEALQVMKAWGFTYKTVAFNWIKTQNDKIITYGLGNYTRSGSELCLLGIRGFMPVEDKSVPQVVVAPRQEHSRKPAVVRHLIQRLYPRAEKVELFARQETKGWDSNMKLEIKDFCGVNDLVEVHFICDTCDYEDTFIIQSGNPFFCPKCDTRYD